MKKQRKTEFKEHRTSWKWFENQFYSRHGVADRLKMPDAFLMRIQIEILKELQYINDKK